MSVGQAATPQRMAHIDPRIADRLAARLESQKPDYLMETLGISVNTWVKIRRGQPIRASVATRLLRRIGQLGDDGCIAN
ncbi:hypothetical protein EBBID32_36390 [Sphingobium indicum BiD32]|uniref:XRE family transcriptional regulator n=1 Tax=Sphingobium indicum BiD32 TaxID=1301087 RepID=N1MVD3_9SPHN|nr:hypothetical protein [Sphingobium indicum]CCW19273.1 hypothetical protein EBBID32_36390 [Sphingobium indicum BiD32]